MPSIHQCVDEAGAAADRDQATYTHDDGHETVLAARAKRHAHYGWRDSRTCADAKHEGDDGARQRLSVGIAHAEIGAEVLPVVHGERRQHAAVHLHRLERLGVLRIADRRHPRGHHLRRPVVH